MRRRLFFIIALLPACTPAFSQTYQMSASTTGFASYATACGGTFSDNGGNGGNYGNGIDASYTFYPTSITQYTRITFTSFNTEPTWDVVCVYDGPGGPLIGSYSGTLGTFSVTASASNSTHGLTVRFQTDGMTTAPGWMANVSCVSTPGAPPAFVSNVQDCEQGGGITICSNSSFNGNSLGGGPVDDLNAPWDGCLNGEHQSSWYYFSPATPGNIGFSIMPANGTDDYDFAVWGPFTSVSCPLNLGVQPLRCSYAAGGGATGCGNGAIDVSENAFGDRWVSTFNVAAGEVYVLIVDNYTSSSSPFSLTWNLSGGVSLNCSVLPVNFVSFTGYEKQSIHHLDWQTASENNNDYFTVERATDGEGFTAIGRVNGAGTSTQLNSYSFDDTHPREGMNYYRIRQTDINGQPTFTQIVALNYHTTSDYVENVYPVPTSGAVNFDFVSPDETDIHLTISDVTGRIVLSEDHHVSAGKNTISTFISETNNGMYLLRVADDKAGFSFVQRITKL